MSQGSVENDTSAVANRLSGVGNGLSVVVPSVNELSDVVDCLTALERQRDATDLEVLLVERLGEVVRDAVAQRFPWVRILPVPGDTTIPEMRATAFREATRDAVAVIEDHVIVPDGWSEALLAGLAEGAQVVAGSVANAADQSLLDQACFLCEYHHLLPPIASGPVESVTGNNVVYRRALLEQFSEITAQGRWENHLHDALRSAGVELICLPEIVVGHKKHYSFGEYFSQRYLYARSFAGERAAGGSAARRLLLGLAAFALPPLLLARIVGTVRAKGGHDAVLLRCLPLLSCFVVSWAFGEVVGAWCGPGDSLSRVR